MMLAANVGYTDVVMELVKAEANLDLQNKVYTRDAHVHLLPPAWKTCAHRTQPYSQFVVAGK